MKRLLYVIDERGLQGGAHIASELLITALQKRGYAVDVMQAIPRNSFWGLVARAYARINSTLHLHLPPTPNFLRDPFGFKFRQMFRYDTVCVAGEASVLSPVVAKLPAPVRKVQMIHINYPVWAKLTHRDMEADGKLYAQMDCIACVGIIGAKQFEEMFPACKSKVVPFHNIIEQDGRARHSVTAAGHDGPVRLISLARIDDYLQKDGPRMIRVAKRLKDAGIDFVWDNYGGSGNGFDACCRKVESLGIEDVFRLHPFDPNARSKIGSADVFALLSHFEGLPNVIYESLMAGTPVFTTDVCGIPEQIKEGFSGWLVQDDDDAIYDKMATLLKKPAEVMRIRGNVSDYRYDNDKVVCEHERFLFK